MYIVILPDKMNVLISLDFFVLVKNGLISAAIEHSTDPLELYQKALISKSAEDFISYCLPETNWSSKSYDIIL